MKSLTRIQSVKGSLLRLLFLPMLSLGVVFLSGVISKSALAEDVKARKIMQKVQDREDGDNQISDMEMILIDKKKNKRIRKLRSFRKYKAEDTQSIMFFLSPADVKGTGFLTYDYNDSGKNDDQWLFLPALRKTKRIASDDQSGSFMGSDFNYSDLNEGNLDDSDFSLMKEVDINGIKTWQIESKPRSKEIADETGYSKAIFWVRQDNYVVIRAVRWINKSKRRKYFQVKELKKIDGIWIATNQQMVTKEGRKTVHSTVLRFKNVKFNQNLKGSLFTVRQLEKGI